MGKHFRLVAHSQAKLTWAGSIRCNEMQTYSDGVQSLLRRKFARDNTGIKQRDIADRAPLLTIFFRLSKSIDLEIVNFQSVY